MRADVPDRRSAPHRSPHIAGAATAGCPLRGLRGRRRLPLPLRTPGASRQLPALRMQELPGRSDRGPLPKPCRSCRPVEAIEDPIGLQTRAAGGNSMKLKCDSKTLARALDAVERVVKPRIVTPILGHVLLEAYGDRLRLTTTDLEIGVRTSIAAEVAEEGATTAPVRLVAGVVGELPQGQVTLALKDGRLRISSGRFGSTLHTTDVGKFPPGPQAAEDEPIRLPQDEFL